MERYISLYPAGQAKDEAGDEPSAKRALHSERPPMWKEIEEAMQQGQTALERIQERRPEQPGAAGSAAEVSAQVQAKRDLKDRGAKSDKGDKLQQKANAKPAAEKQGNRRERRRALAEEKEKAKEEGQDSGDDSDFFG